MGAYSWKKSKICSKSQIFASVCSTPGEEERKNSMLHMWSTLFNTSMDCLGRHYGKEHNIRTGTEATALPGLHLPTSTTTSPSPWEPGARQFDMTFPLAVQLHGFAQFCVTLQILNGVLARSKQALYSLSTSIIKSFFLKIKSDGSTFRSGFRLSTSEERQMGSNIQICRNILNQACIINLSHSSRKNSFCPYKSYMFVKVISCVTLLFSSVVTWRIN